MKLRIGEIFRLSNDYSTDNQEFIDGYKNFIYYTRSENAESTFRFQRGIHPAKRISSVDSERIPVIIISSSPHKSGTEDTPWKDRYDPDNGCVIYYGDCKDANTNPSEASGNKVLIEEWKKHNSSNEKIRNQATPFVFFERTSKGYLQFHGIGVLEKVSLITQKLENTEFINFEFEFCVLDLAEENNQLDWNWISDRCNSNLTIEKANAKAPKAWKFWLKNGNEKLEKVRRHVIKSSIISEKDQKTVQGSFEERILKKIEAHYKNKKLQFELFALQITNFFFMENRIKCLDGFITKGSGDKGIDFISRIDIGHDLSGIRMVVIGQAKCQSDTINSKDIARTIAKLKRNYVGVFVTNSTFSRQTQEEILEDQYPLIMINGIKIAQLVNKYVLGSSKNLNVLETYLNTLDEQYDNCKSNIRPDDIIYK